MKDKFQIDYTVADVLMVYAGDGSIFRCPSYAPSDIYPECVRWGYAYEAAGCRIDWGNPNDPYYGDPSRAWLACDDPAHGWVRETWQGQQPDPRLTTPGALTGEAP